MGQPRSVLSSPLHGSQNNDQLFIAEHCRPAESLESHTCFTRTSQLGSTGPASRTWQSCVLLSVRGVGWAAEMCGITPFCTLLDHSHIVARGRYWGPSIKSLPLGPRQSSAHRAPGASRQLCRGLLSLLSADSVTGSPAQRSVFCLSQRYNDAHRYSTDLRCRRGRLGIYDATFG